MQGLHLLVWTLPSWPTAGDQQGRGLPVLEGQRGLIVNHRQLKQAVPSAHDYG